MFDKKETDSQIQDRLLDLCKYKGDEGYAPAMDAETALRELCHHFLGEDWYVVDPLGQTQINTIIVYEIERKYRNKQKNRTKKRGC